MADTRQVLLAEPKIRMSDNENPSHPSVDVLIRTTGRPELTRTLQSLSAQTYAAIHVFMADAAGRGLPRPEGYSFPITVVSNGQAMPRSIAANALLEHSTSSLAIFLDDDDWLEPDHIQKLVLALQQSPLAVLAFTDTRCVQLSETGEETVIRRYESVYCAEHLMLENYIPIHAALFRRNPKTAHLRFDADLDLFEDWDYWLQLQQVGEFVHTPGLSAVYRLHRGAGTGIQFDRPELALDTLKTLLRKWTAAWSPEQLQRLWGYARQVTVLDMAQPQLRQSGLELRNLLNEKLDQIAQMAEQMQNMRASHESEIDHLRQGYEHEIKRLEALRQDQVQALLNSRSWKITAPLRYLHQCAKAITGKVFPVSVQKISHRTLEFLTHAYRSERLQWLAKRVPSSLKRSVRNGLMYLSHDRAHLANPATSGLQHDSSQPLKVSVIIPVYNHAQYLSQCIESAVHQSYAHTEVVIVDDCSSDPQVQQLLQVYASNTKVKLLRNATNLGIAETQNVALAAATGQLFAFLDCDDYLVPDAIATCVQHWKSDTVYMHTGRINVDHEGKEIQRIHFMGLPRQDYFAENLRAMFATHLKIIHRSAFARYGVFDPRYDSAQDYEMLMRIAFHYPSSAFVHIPDFVYCHRLHPGQTSEAQHDHQKQLTLQIRNEAELRRSIRQGQYGRFISIIMLSYGKHTQTLQAIEGLQKTVRIPHEVILYDNGSAAETVEFLRQRIDGQFPDVKVIYGDTNLGPAQGRRKALEYARGEWFIIFDNDEIPEPGWMEELLLRAEQDPSAGAVCCRVVFPNGKLQFSGGMVNRPEPKAPFIELGLHDSGKPYTDLETCRWREVDWCPIGATLFTVNIAPYLHDGYPNVFEDAGVSFALKKAGYRLFNAPGALVWHEHVSFRPRVDMGKKYLADRYNPKMMLKSIASFYAENGLIIRDEYIWRENGLNALTQQQLTELLDQARQMPTAFH